MKLSEIENLIPNEHKAKYRCKLEDGTTKVVRLWKTKDGRVAIISKGRQVYGHYLEDWCDHYSKWVSLKPVEARGTDRAKLVRKRAMDAVKYLTNSGLWPSIKAEIEYFLANVDIEDFCKDMEEDFYEKFYCQRNSGQKYEWCKTSQVFESFFAKKCWQSVPWPKWSRATRQAEVEKALANHEEFRRRWTNGYDNTIELTFENNYPRGWLSCEYRGCGNGHYYLMFDATHAIFYEDD